LEQRYRVIATPLCQYGRDYATMPCSRDAVSYHQNEAMTTYINQLKFTTRLPILYILPNSCVQSHFAGIVCVKLPQAQVAESSMVREQAMKLDNSLLPDSHRLAYIYHQRNLKPAC